MKMKKILICDDEAGVREALEAILEKDYEVVSVATGDEAIENLKKTRFDGALIDIKMPDKDGLEILKEVLKIVPTLKVIMVSGYKTVEAASQAIKLGAVDYITKPFDEKEVKEKVSRF